MGSPRFRIEFVSIWGSTYTCDSNNESNGKLDLIKAAEFLFWSMKKREINLIGLLVLEFLKEHASALYELLGVRAYP